MAKREELHNDAKAGKAIIASTLLTFGSMAINYAKTENDIKKLTEEIEEINAEINAEKNVGWFYRDKKKIKELEQLRDTKIVERNKLRNKKL